jgi:four helix bundle protein
MIDFVKNDLTLSRKTLYWHRNWICNVSADADVMNCNLLRVMNCRMKWIADLEIYSIARTLGKKARHIYKRLNFDLKKILWSQFVRAIDSIWANIAEWFGRFHYLDSIKFYYTARWSLQESKHWIETLHDRNLLSEYEYTQFIHNLDILSVKLNNFITKAKKILTKN